MDIDIVGFYEERVLLLNEEEGCGGDGRSFTEEVALRRDGLTGGGSGTRPATNRVGETYLTGRNTGGADKQADVSTNADAPGGGYESVSEIAVQPVRHTTFADEDARPPRTEYVRAKFLR